MNINHAVKNQNHFSVGIRIRPPNNSNLSSNSNIKFEIASNELRIQNPYSSYTNKNRKFIFNNIFSQQSTNLSIFTNIIQQKLQMINKGYNIALMAYGVTGSGKTYTIFGKEQDKGLALLSFDYIIQNMLKGSNFSFSYLQVYNENVHDLLADDQNLKNLPILEDEDGQIVIPQLQKINITNSKQIHQLISKGNKRRKSSSTLYNEVSSRSHAILQLHIHDTKLKISSKLTVIDLAGSQRNSTTQRSVLLKEGSSINKSLLSLANCIKSLQSQSPYIPYRNSKLTRILKENLSGSSYNVLIGCLSTNPQQYQQTINTLQYASQAASIKRHIKCNDYFEGFTCEGIICPSCQEKIKWNYVQQIALKANKEFQFINANQTNIILQQFQILNKQIEKIIKVIFNNNKFNDTLFESNSFEIQTKINDIKLLIDSHKDKIINDLSNLKTQKKAYYKNTPKTASNSIQIIKRQIPIKRFQLTLDLTDQHMIVQRDQILKENIKDKNYIKAKQLNQFKKQENILTQRMAKDAQIQNDIESWKEAILNKINHAVQNNLPTKISQFNVSNDNKIFRNNSQRRNSHKIITKNPWTYVEMHK